VRLRPKGAGYALIPGFETRKTAFGTSELVGLIETAAAAVAEQHPGSVLGVGNLGFESGEKIPWSVSHQAGRDVDLGMFALTENGRPAESLIRGPLPFHAFDERLEARLKGRVIRFDVARNLALVGALVTPTDSRVQYIFVARWLKEALLQEARRAKLPSSAIDRLSEVLHQPSDSNPHADHFHVRLFCTIEDRTFGCVDRGPSRAWVDSGDKAHAEAARRVANIVQMRGKGSERWVLAAIARLARMVAATEVGALVAALEDQRPKVRKAALGALIGIGSSGAADGIVALLPRIQDAAWAIALFEAIPKLDGARLIPLAERIARSPDQLLHPSVRRRAEGPLLVSALGLLAVHGDKTHVPAMLEAAASRDSKIRTAAIAGLRMRTCQPLSTVAAFSAFWSRHARDDEAELAESGLLARGVKLPRGSRSRDGVTRLIALLDKRDAEVRGCAERLLEAVTGHEGDSARSPARNRKHWASWWAENQSSVGVK
jgi:penicillin-insensitive murein endopeptidase